MLRHTFRHLPKVGRTTEQKLWDSGVNSWDDLPMAASIFSTNRLSGLHREIETSHTELDNGNAAYFAEKLPSDEHWRMFADFMDSVCYLDIETTGLYQGPDHITTIALYDGKQIRHYVHGRNLRQFGKDVRDYKLIVTYNGKCFDIPFLNKSGFEVDQAHIDLRYLLAKLGYSGGLKNCEKRLGIDRGDLDGIDGYFAVLLWNEFKRTRSKSALDTLLAYNVEDVLNLEKLMIFAYNEKLKSTPFNRTCSLPDSASLVENPFEVNLKLVDKLKASYFVY